MYTHIHVHIYIYIHAPRCIPTYHIYSFYIHMYSITPHMCGQIYILYTRGVTVQRSHGSVHNPVLDG